MPDQESEEKRKTLDLLKEMLTGGSSGGSNVASSSNVKMRHRAKRKSSSADARMRHSTHGLPEQW